jgi:single-strand DNA-binding protein
MTVDGTAITKFTLEVNRVVASGGQSSDLIDVVAWRKVAEITGQYLKKGSMVLIEGSIHIRAYDEAGTRKWATEVVARNVQFLDRMGKDSPSSAGKEPAKVGSKAAPAAVADSEDDFGIEESDLPF